MIVASALGMALSWPLTFAAQVNEKAAGMAAVERQTSVLGMTNGEIKKIDSDAGKLTIRHDSLANLDMPAMTMSFTTKNLSMCQGLKAGDRVRFVAELINDSLVVTKIKKRLPRDSDRN